MRKILELSLVYFLGLLFIITLALGVNHIERESVSNTSIAQVNQSISNYE